MDEHHVSAVEDEHDDLKQPAVPVEAESELRHWTLVTLWSRVEEMFRGVDGVRFLDAVSER